MKLLLIITFLNLSTNDLTLLREIFEKAYENEKVANQLFAFAVKNAKDKNIYLGYKGAAKIILAKHAGNPFSKWKLFNDGKSILETAIANNINDVELRYLRLTIQLHAPKFLGYSSMIESDKKFLASDAINIEDTQLKKIVTAYLKQIN